MKQGHIYLPDELKTLQCELLEILNEIDIICKKHNIDYFAVGGTLLGAIRHHGFIPWDDDIDIGIFPIFFLFMLKSISFGLSGKIKINVSTSPIIKYKKILIFEGNS